MTEDNFPGHAVIVSHADDLAREVQADGDAIAEVLADRMTCGYRPDNIVRLAGDDATVGAVAQALKSLESIEENEPILFYFSGHGFNNAMTSQTGFLFSDPAVAGGTVPWSSGDFARAWSKVPARRKLVIIDSCHAGGTPAIKNANATGRPLIKKSPFDPSMLASGTGSAVIASSAPHQTSVVMPGDDMSLFTKILVRGLGGAAGHDPDGYVTLFDLFNYVRINVIRSNPHQTPVLSTREIDENFRLAFAQKPAQKDKPWSLAEANDGRSLSTHDILAALYPMGPVQGAIWERSGGDVSRLDFPVRARPYGGTLSES